MGLANAVDELSSIMEQINVLAAEHGLRIVPATPSAGRAPVVELDGDDLAPRDFLDLAAAVGGPLLYLDCERLDDVLVSFTLHGLEEEAREAEQPGQDLQALRRRIAKLRKHVSRLAGWPVRLEMAFVSPGGVVHQWVAEAGWHEELQGEIDELRPPEDEEEAEQLSPEQEEEIIARGADELLALPGFRAASPSKRRDVANRYHATRERDGQSTDEPLPDHLRFATIRRALDAAEVEEQSLYANIEQRLPELARLLAADPAYLAAKTAATRKIRTRDFLAAQARGYPAPTRVVDLMLDFLLSRPQAGLGQGSALF